MDPQAKIEIIKILSASAEQSSREKYGILPIISTLGAALLVVASFNDQLIPLTNFVKIILALLLILIPISIWSFLYVQHYSEKVVREELEKIRGEKMEYGGTLHFLMDIAPYIITGVLTIIILLIIALIFKLRICIGV